MEMFIKLETKTKSVKTKFNLGNGVVNPDGTYQKRIRNKTS
jgi:hypothetical protein